MGHAVRLAGKSRHNAGRCLASLGFVMLLSVAFWSGVLWIAGFLMRPGVLG